MMALRTLYQRQIGDHSTPVSQWQSASSLIPA